jgi:HSP20 family molecular chaperone IbpA
MTTFVSSKPQFYHHNHPWNEGTLEYPNAPDVDVRETNEGYVFELEVPGIHDKKEITLKWTWPRTLVIEGQVPRLGVEPPASVKADKKESDNANAQGDGKMQPRLLLAERRVGPWERHFNFPIDVHKKEVRAHLGDGILRVWVKKLEEKKGEKAEEDKGADVEWV